MDGVAARRAALEDKRRRLEEMKARRSQRSTNTAEPSASSAGAGLDEYIDGLLAKPNPAVPVTDEEKTDAVPDEDSFVDSASKDKKEDMREESVVTESTPVEVVSKPDVEMFELGTQTEFPWPPEYEESDNQSVPVIIETDDAKEDDVSDENGQVTSTQTDLTVQQKERFVQTPSFSHFLNATSKRVEKLLSSVPSIAEQLVYVDYTADRGNESKIDGAVDGAGIISARSVYECQEWTKNRSITCIDWSNTYKELAVVGYTLPSDVVGDALPLPSKNSLNSSSPHSQLASMSPSSGSIFKGTAATASDGLALVWNLAMTNRPEHIFTCWSPVVACKFHPSEPHLVIGACQSGQIVLWDFRAGRLPVQKSSLGFTSGGPSSKAHSYPITALELIDSGNGLVTSDTEGKINIWSLGQLREPIESLNLNNHVSALTVAEGDTIICGDDNGDLYSISASSVATSRASTGTSRRAIKKFDTTENNHFSLVSSIAAKSTPGSTSSKSMARGFAKGSAGLVLSCGLDWTTKIWAPAHSDNPILSFLSHSYDYSCDVQWSPTNPCLFALASSNGKLSLWNLAESFDQPLNGDGILMRTGEGEEQYALSKVRWSSDGRRLAVGSGDQLHILGVNDEIAKAKEDDETKMMERFSSRRLIK